MTTIQTDQVPMADGSRVFDHVVTPLLRPIVLSVPPADRQAWWDGFLASCVGAMTVSMGETRTRQSCFDLWVRAKEWEHEQELVKAAGGQ
jgi:hypothetical protein